MNLWCPYKPSHLFKESFDQNINQLSCFLTAVIAIIHRNRFHGMTYHFFMFLERRMGKIFDRNLRGILHEITRFRSMHNFIISQLIRALWLVKWAGHISLYASLNSKVCLNWNLPPLFEPGDIMNISVTRFSRAVLLVTNSARKRCLELVFPSFVFKICMLLYLLNNLYCNEVEPTNQWTVI